MITPAAYMPFSYSIRLYLCLIYLRKIPTTEILKHDSSGSHPLWPRLNTDPSSPPHTITFRPLHFYTGTEHHIITQIQFQFIEQCQFIWIQLGRTSPFFLLLLKSHSFSSTEFSFLTLPYPHTHWKSGESCQTLVFPNDWLHFYTSLTINLHILFIFIYYMRTYSCKSRVGMQQCQEKTI